MNKAQLKLHIRLARDLMGMKRVHLLKLSKAGEFAVHGNQKILVHIHQSEVRSWSPLTSRGDALEVLEACANRLEDRKHGAGNSVSIKKSDGMFIVSSETKSAFAPDLNLAICMFADNLLTPSARKR